MNHSDEPYTGKPDPRADTADAEPQPEQPERCEVCAGEGGLSSPCPQCGAQMPWDASEPVLPRCKDCNECHGTGHMVPPTLADPMGQPCTVCDRQVSPYKGGMSLGEIVEDEGGLPCQGCAGEGGILSPCPQCGMMMTVADLPDHPDIPKNTAGQHGEDLPVGNLMPEPPPRAVLLNPIEQRTPDNSLRRLAEGEEKTAILKEAYPEGSAKGRGPRITPEDIEQELLYGTQQYHRFPNTTMTICCHTMSNGFCVVGKAAAVSLENFDAQIGRDVALDEVRNQLWQFLGFRLKQALFEGALI